MTPILSMETQGRVDMAHEESQEEPTEEMRETETQFLKDLYGFMRKRDTPIERIPNLGFKQIDLFLMFTTVRDMGGYHQVTSQQLWKQVYNMLGGNPRSTSAATCTRRHYEKLLLPYECHITGVSVNVVPQQPKHIHYSTYSKYADDGPGPAKRKMLSMPPHQSPHAPQPDRHRSAFPLPLSYPRYYHPSHAVLPPHVPISSQVMTPLSPPAPQPRFPFDPYALSAAESVKEPLEHLRFLAERYKTSSGLSEPLNLSVKASRQETSSSSSSPASSFAPPPTNKNPKFLNKPSPLYSPQHPPVVRSEKCETQEGGETGAGDRPYSYPVRARAAHVDVKAVTAPSSPEYDPAATLRADEVARNHHSSPLRPMEEREGSPEVSSGFDILPGLPRQTGGKMEIEIPMSVFHSWLKLWRSSATMRGDKQPPPAPEEQFGKGNCSGTDVLATNLTFRVNPPRRSPSPSPSPEDLRLSQRSLPSPAPTAQTSGNHGNASQDPFTSYKPLSSRGILRGAASRDVYPFDRQEKPYSSLPPPRYWGPHDLGVQAKTDSNPLTPHQNFTASKSYNEDKVQGGKAQPDVGPGNAVLMLNSGSTPLLRLTTEEVMKLKKIISNSS